MKSIILRLNLIAFLILLFATPAYAVFGFGGEKIVKVMDFPQTATFQTPSGEHLDPGIIFKQFTIVFIPIWNYDKRWCGYVGSDKNYLKIDYEELSGLAQRGGLKLPDEVPMPFWDAYGGKLAFGVIFFLIGRSKSD